MIELSNCLWVPRADVKRSTLDSLEFSVYDMAGTTATHVKAYREDRKGFIGLPRSFGLKLISNSAEVVDRRSAGCRVKFPKKIKLRDEQVPFVEDIFRRTTETSDFIAKAGTGKGKTVCALEVIRRRGRSAAVIVDQENLLDQWVERIEEHLGLTRDDIGIVRGATCKYKGKAITICMVQTLAVREMDPEFYSYFGTLVVDECHTAGAPTFAVALMDFNAEVRFGVSATPDRRDSMRKVLLWNLGTVDVALDTKHDRSLVYVMESHGTYSWRVNNSRMTGGFISEVADDGERNLMLVRAAIWLYQTGRDVLVIGDRAEQLCSLMALAETCGVPPEDLGLYARTKTVYRWEMDPFPSRRPVGWEKGTEYTPVRLALATKTVPKRELVEVAQRAKIMFATYGIMAKGVDIPRLCAGIDVTPRADATQVHGRILRIAEGKLIPIWATVADVNSFRSLYQLSNRLRDYEESNAEVFLWDMNKGRRSLDVKAYRRELADRVSLLRQSKIVTRPDGNNTLMIPSTLTDSESLPARRTAKRTR